MAHRAPRVFTIPSGAPFLPTLSRALLDGVLIEGFPGAGGPMALADATIYVPTQRAAQALAKALLSASGGRSLLLPRIAPLGAFEPDETAAVFDPEGEEPRARPCLLRSARSRAAMRSRPSPAPGERRCEARFARSDADGRLIVDAAEPALVAATPAQAYALAGDLAALIDDMIIEGAPWTRLETLAPDLYDPYWRITLDFLKIAFAHWPEWLAERGLIDRAKRIALLIEDEIKALEGARRGPTIIAGSTGANRATARLIAAIARAPQGRGRAARSRPQSRRSNLGDDRRARTTVRRRSRAIPGAAAPADWRNRRQARGCHNSRRALACACGALRLPERGASSRRVRPISGASEGGRCRRWPSPPRFKASRSSSPTTRTKRRLALAIAMRETLETPGKTAALVTPDPVDRAPSLGRACPMGRRGRGFGRTDAGAKPGGRAGQAHP